MSRLVRVLTTGGTIASRRTADGDVLAQDRGELVLRGMGASAGDITVKTEEVFVLGSYRLALDEVLEVARRVEVAASDPAVAGVVVAHGTDTMEETAYLVDLLHQAATPVVFTGAQRAADDPDADGPHNLRTAIRLAGTPEARGLGAVITMAGRAFAAREATKAHTLALDAFAAPGGGPVAEVFGEHVLIHHMPRRGPRFDISAVKSLPRVDIVSLYVGADAALLQAARAAGAAGIVLEAFGAGNATPAVAAEAAACVEAGVPVLVTSRTLAGPVTPLYGGGGGADLEKAGAVFAGTLRAPKARLLLAVALAVSGEPSSALRALDPHITL